MSLNRGVFSFIFILYVSLARPPGYEIALVVLGVGALVTLGIFVHILIAPGANATRRLVALIADLAAICYVMHMGGSSTGLFYPLLLWTILGNGLRFGIPTLIRATLLGMAGFTLVVVSTPFWLGHLSLASGLILGLIMIPVYAGMLLKSLTKARQAAEAANQAKTVFLASVSHELRTPLHAIIASSSLLKRTELDAEQLELGSTIMHASKSLLGLIDDLLKYSMIEAGALSLEAVDFALPGTLLAVRDIMLPAAEAKGLRLAVHVDHQVPLALHGDQRHVQAVLLNLTSNAIKFTSFGGVLISVAPAPPPAVVPGARARGAAHDAPRLRFEVTDTGIGVSPNAHARIFERFTQADETIGARFGGTGLGLAICKRLVESLGGQIGLQSQAGSGSTFWFELPLAPAAVAAPEIGAPETGAPETGAPEIGAPEIGAPEIAVARFAWPEEVVTVGLEEAATGPVVATLAASGARLRRVGFDGAELAAALRASATPGGPLVIAAPMRPAEMEALTAAARSESRNLLPALVLLGNAAAETRWVVPTWLPTACDADAVTAAARLALALAQPADRAASEEAPAAAETPSLRVLVADDNRLNQRVVGKILEAGGHRYDVVSNGEAALDALQVTEYDLVLMDVNMPVLDGIEATKLYRVMAMGERHVPIIGVTADAGEEVAARCRDAGMDRVIVKPVAAQELLDAIAHCAAPPADSAAKPALRPVEDVVLDENRLRDLGGLGGEGFVLDLLQGFAGEAQELADNIETALDDSNWPAFRASAHAVASSAANLGAVRVHHIAIGLQRMAPPDIRKHGRARLGEIRRELDRVQQAAVEFEARHPGAATEAGAGLAPIAAATPEGEGWSRVARFPQAAADPLTPRRARAGADGAGTDGPAPW